jgi:hypothetical protein
MARVSIRYYVTRRRADGSARYYWSPTRALIAAGWHLETLPDDEGEAQARARVLNDALDRWRRGEGPAGNHAIDGETPQQARHAGAIIPAAGRMVTPRDNRPPTLRPAMPRPDKADMAWLVADFMATPKWTAPAGSSIRPLAPTTRRQYAWAFEVILDWTQKGRTTIRSVNDPPRINTLYEELLKASHSKANAVVGALRMLLEHARRRGMIKINQARRPGMIGLPPRLRIWSHDEVDCMVAHADALGWPSVGDAILAAADLGQRESDILALHRLRFASGTAFLQQHKTGARVAVPATPRLRARIAAALTRIDAAAEGRRQEAIAMGRPARPTPPWLILCESTLARWQTDHFRRIFARIRAAAAGQRIKVSRKPGVETMNDEDLLRTSHLPKCRSLLGLPANDATGQPALHAANFQDLRDTAVTNMAEGGATIPEICAVTGHMEKSAYNVLKHYLALNGAMAGSAIAKLVTLHDQREADRKRAAAEGDGA